MPLLLHHTCSAASHLCVPLQGLSEVESMVRALQLVSVLVEVRGRSIHTIHTGCGPLQLVSAGGGEGKEHHSHGEMQSVSSHTFMVHTILTASGLLPPSPPPLPLGDG